MTRNESAVFDLPETLPDLLTFPLKRRNTPVAVIRRRGRVTMTGQTISLSDTEPYTHLQVRRFAGCPNGQASVRFRRKGERLCHP
jgi:hypothetical protein